jgi:hypothetical protein
LRTAETDRKERICGITNGRNLRTEKRGRKKEKGRRKRDGRGKREEERGKSRVK